MEKVSNPAKVLAQQLLARQEVPWLPIRDDYRHAPAICARRAGEVGFGPLREEANERKHRSRQLAELRREKLVQGCTLTAKGRRWARSASYHYRRQDVAEAFRRLKWCLDRRHYIVAQDNHWVPEAFVAGPGRGIGCLQVLLLPWLVHGTLESGSLTTGHAYYAVTGKLPKFDTLIGRLQFDGSLCEAYATEFDACRDVMLSDRSYYQELGEIPLAPLRLESGRDYQDLAGITPLFEAVDA